MNVVLLGAPGSGKGTQATIVTGRLGLAHVATGDLFRHHLKARTELGREVESFMNRGALVPDDVTIAMVRERLAQPDVAAGVLFDGFPRTLNQAHALDGLLAGMGQRVDRAVYLDVPDDAIVGRLSGRLVCRECEAPFHVDAKPFATCPHGRCSGEHLARRPDDEPETVRRRLAIFHQQTAPVVEHYRAAGILVCVAGQGPVDAIGQAILDAVGGMATGAADTRRA